MFRMERGITRKYSGDTLPLISTTTLVSFLCMLIVINKVPVPPSILKMCSIIGKLFSQEFHVHICLEITVI